LAQQAIVIRFCPSSWKTTFAATSAKKKNFEIKSRKKKKDPNPKWKSLGRGDESQGGAESKQVQKENMPSAL
jgi:hypothetical protein